MINATTIKDILLKNKASSAGKTALFWGELGAKAVIKAHQKLLRLLPNSSHLHSSYGHWLSVLEQREQAVAALEIATRLNPSTTKDWETLASFYEKQNKPWLQLEAMRAAVATGKVTASRLHRLAVVEAKMHRFPEASDAFERALALRPRSDKWFCEYGLMLLAAGDPDRAQTQFRLAETVSADNNVRRFGIGHLMQKLGRWTEAAEAFRRRAEANLEDGELCYRTGQAYDYCYRWDEAIKWYRLGLHTSPNRAHWYIRLGFALERTHAYLEAAENYRHGIDLDQKQSWWFRLGVVLDKAGESSAAADALLRALLGRSHLHWFSTTQEKEIPEAILDYSSKALKTVAKDAKGRRAWKTAADALRAVIDRSNSHTPSTYVELGYALIRSGRIKEGIDALIAARIDAPSYGMDHAIFKRSAGRTLLENYSLYRCNLPIRSKTIVYESFGGGSVSDSPLALFRNLLRDPLFDDWLHVWVFNDADQAPAEYKNRANVVFIAKETDAYARYLATASHLVNNSTFPSWFSRRDEQRYLNTWHGTPLKTLGIKMNGRFLEHANGARNFLQATHLVTPNEHTTRSTVDDFGLKGLIEHKIRETGYPRADLVLETDEHKLSQTKAALGVEGDKPILFYAPTWRGIHGKVNVDIPRLKADLSALQTMNYEIVYRGHSMEQKALASLSLDVTIAPPEVDTNDILAVADVLVTDYSSVFFEFIPRRKPIIYYAYDLEEYAAERGLYLDLEAMPGRIVRTIDELVEAVATATVDHESYDGAIAEFCAHDDGRGTERAKSFFFDTLPVKHDGEHKKKVLFYGGPFMANGITASFCNLSNALPHDQVDAYLALDPKAIQKEERRQQQIARLPQQLQLLGRVGAMPMTPEERWVVNRALTMEAIAAPELARILQQAHRKEFVRMFSDTCFDAVVHFEGYNTFWSMLLGNSGAPRKVAYMHNDMYQEWFTKNPPLKYLFRSFRDYDVLVSVSERLREHNQEAMSAAFDLDASRFVAAPNLILPEEILSQSLLALDDDLVRWYEGESTLTAVGRLSPEKDHQKLIRAFSVAAAAHPSAKLVIIGDGPLRTTLEHLVRSLDLQDRVLLAGHRDNAFPAMKNSACLVLSSNHEGQPMVLLEAMTLGLPILATDIPGNRGVLKGEYGILVRNTESDLAEQLEKFLAGAVRQSFNFNATSYREKAMTAFLALTQKQGTAA